MDSITLILTALTAGAASPKVTAVQDAYTELKTLIQLKFESKHIAVIALTEFEKRPEIWKAPLEEELRKTGSEQDEKIIVEAKKVVALSQDKQITTGKYNMQMTGNVQGIVIGDNQQMTMSFGNISKENR